jgi:hypothetical protein
MIPHVGILDLDVTPGVEDLPLVEVMEVDSFFDK